MADIDTDQERWNEYGRHQLDQLAVNPERFMIDTRTSPMPYRLDDHQVKDLRDILGDLSGKRVLEIGCGYGKFATYLAKLGADVTALDLGYDLVAATRALAAVNGVECTVAQANIRTLPFASGSFDCVLGLAVLHHLSTADVAAAVADSRRLLRPSGIAVFYETIEDSPSFNFLQKLIPAGAKGRPHYRPSMLRRRAWRQFVEELDEREMTTAEFVDAGRDFVSVSVSVYGLLSRLERLGIPQSWVRGLSRVDRAVLARAAFLRRFGRFALVTYRA